MIKLLDTTLRDGSYVVNFQFTARDTALIAAKLDTVGVPYIEVGHGLGLGAGARADMRAAESDAAYCEAAASAVKNNKWGMFFIPSIGKLEDLRVAARYGMDFIRIGTNVTETQQAEPFMREARELGMEVFSNFMKTYALTPEEVADRAAACATAGANYVCVVDSAGGMLAEDVAAYVRSIRARCDVPVGFHGHNNLGMAISNSLAAIEAGAAVIDTSVRGMGRSSGNAVTEILVLALKRKGIDLRIDVNAVLDLAEKVIDPLLQNYRQVDSIGIVSGYAQFHSAFLEKVLRCASGHRVDPRELIVRLTRIDRVSAPDELVEQLAQQLASERTAPVARIEVGSPRSRPRTEDTDLREQARAVAAQASNLARRWTRESVFNLVQSVRPGQESHISPVIYEGHEYIVASAEVASVEEASALAEAIDGLVKYVLTDVDAKGPQSECLIAAVRAALKKSEMLHYSDTDVWARTVVQLASEHLAESDLQWVAVVGQNHLARAVLGQLVLRRTTIVTADSLTSVEGRAGGILIVCERVAGQAVPAAFSSSQLVVIDAWLGSLDDEQLSALRSNGARIVRPEMHQLIQAEIRSAIGVRQLVRGRQGTRSIEGIEVASGGLVAAAGCVVVDSFEQPHQVYGIADGHGFLKADGALAPQERTRLERVESYILAASFD
jgi:4-hydroxy-2-oxovalerate aldolase